ncbi:MAG: DUF5050 domain-containing protein [Eubacteriales bacterium]
MKMKKTFCLLAAILLHACGCDKYPDTDTEKPAESISDAPLTMHSGSGLQYANGALYAKIGVSYNAYLVRYSCHSGRVSAVCPDPLCFHNNEACPMVGILNWNVLPDGSISYAQKFDRTYHNDAGIIQKEIHIFNHALYNPAENQKTVLYDYDDSFFSGPELYTEDYRFYPGIEYDTEREIYMTGLFRMDLKNGAIRPLILSDTSEDNDTFNISSELFMIRDDRIYLCDGISVFSVDFNGENRITYAEGLFPMSLQCDGEYIYYQREDGIYRTSLSGGEEEQLAACDNLYGSIFLTEHWVYYQAGDTISLGALYLEGSSETSADLSGGSFFRCAHDGSQKEQVASMNGDYTNLRLSGMMVIDQYIYGNIRGWDDRNGDGIYDQMITGMHADSLDIMRIDITDGTISIITLK